MIDYQRLYPVFRVVQKFQQHIEIPCISFKRLPGIVVALQANAYMRKKRPHRSLTKNCNGFTLIEIIAVLVILSILGAITVPRVVALDTFATQKSFEWAINELNGRECISWSKIKTSDSNWLGDEQLFAEMDTDLGAEYIWSSKTAGGATLHFRGQQIGLERIPSTYLKSGTWRMK